MRPSCRTRRIRNGQSESSPASRTGPETVEGTLVALASIVELSLVELDEQPTLDGVLPAQAASAEAASAEARARTRILE